MVTTYSCRNRFAVAPRAALSLALAAVCLVQFGCKSTLDVSSLKNFGRSNEKEAEYASALDEEEEKLSPLDRVMQAVGRSKEEAARRNYRPAEGIAEFEQAEKLFDDEQYKAAEKEFNRIAKKYKNSQIEEDALFMRAESLFEQERYSWAQDAYDTLFDKFPSTRYMNQSTQRLFTIARTWLRFPEVVTAGDIQQVDFENPKKTPLPEDKSGEKQSFQLTRAVPILPNFVDRARPVFDTEGRALQALKSIWLHDPTGPLADDALMLTASYHLRKGDNMEAARVYKILRQEYPKSQHLENAFVLGSHVRLMSYQGDKYDGKSLEEARQLTESTLKLFPQTRERDRLQRDLEMITEAEAARDWEMVEFYEKKGNPTAVATYCRIILDKYSATSYAGQARDKLDQLRAEAANPSSFGQRFVSALPGLPRRDAEAPARRVTRPDADIPVIKDEPAEEEAPGIGQRFLQRMNSVPKLLRIPGSGDEETAPSDGEK